MTAKLPDPDEEMTVTFPENDKTKPEPDKVTVIIILKERWKNDHKIPEPEIVTQIPRQKWQSGHQIREPTDVATVMFPVKDERVTIKSQMQKQTKQ